MTIAGFEKTATRDWEGKNPCKISLHGCNFRCPFCNRPDLVCGSCTQDVDIMTIRDYIMDNRDFVDAAIVSGGEPTLDPKLYKLLMELKKTDVHISLETNGSNPECLDDLIGAKLVDRVVMNIPAPLVSDKYSNMAGVPVNIERIGRSIDLILDCGIKNEFRTVAVPGHVDIDDIELISKRIKGAGNYAIHQFDPKNTLDVRYSELRPYPKSVLMKMAENARKYVKNIKIKGV